MRFVLLAAGAALCLLALFMGFAANFSALVVVAFCMGALMMIYGAFLPNRKIIARVTVAASCLFVLFIGFNVFLYRFGQSDNPAYQEDALIVLGAGIVGETPSLILRERLDAALAYFEKNPNVIIVVSGGRGPNESITEALAMERYLAAHGVPLSHIWKEEQATTTRENFLFAKALLDEALGGTYTIAFVTSDFHVFRSGLIAARCGLSAVHLHGKIPRYSVPANSIRETIAVLFELALPY